MSELHEYTKEQKLKMEAWMVNTMQKCKKKNLGIHDKRSFTFEKIELVVYQAEINEWQSIFEADYNGTKKMPGIKPSDDDMRLTRTYGGINEFQTLFVNALDQDLIAIAMFWPWNDKEHMTLHMGFVHKNLPDTNIL